jgi:hypothetical protein
MRTDRCGLMFANLQQVDNNLHLTGWHRSTWDLFSWQMYTFINDLCLDDVYVLRLTVFSLFTVYIISLSSLKMNDRSTIKGICSFIFSLSDLKLWDFYTARTFFSKRVVVCNTLKRLIP